MEIKTNKRVIMDWYLNTEGENKYLKLDLAKKIRTKEGETFKTQLLYVNFKEEEEIRDILEKLQAGVREIKEVFII